MGNEDGLVGVQATDPLGEWFLSRRVGEWESGSTPTAMH